MPDAESLKLNSDFDIVYKESAITGTSDAYEFNHFHEDFEMVFYTKARAKMFIKDIRYDIGDGDILFINEFDMHSFIIDEKSVYKRYVLIFKKAFIKKILEALSLEGSFFQLREGYRKVSTDLMQRSRFEQLFNSLLAAWNSPAYCRSPLAAAEVKLIFSDILIHFIKLANESTMKHKAQKNDAQVSKIIQYIDSNYMNPLGLDLLESEFFMDKYHICHIFKEITGLSVIEYLHFRRVIEAQKMLKNSSRDITGICYDCGFNNIQHFHRVFKEIAKTTPSKYRKSSDSIQ